jgi:hypothetical protein
MNKTFGEQMRDVLIGLGVSDIDKLNVTEIKELYFDMVYKSDEEGFMNPGEIEKEFFSPENSLMQGVIDDKQYKKIKELESPLLEVLEQGKPYGQNGKNLYGDSSEAVADSLKSFGGKVAWVESDNIPDRIQESGGPGRGKYQYEMNVFTGGLDENPQGAAETAVKRLINAYEGYGMEIPKEWSTLLDLNNLDSPSYNIDFSKLPENLQDELFYADKQQDPDFKLGKLGSGELSMEDAWLDFHWAGWSKEANPQQAREKKAKWYRGKIKEMNKGY